MPSVSDGTICCEATNQAEMLPDQDRSPVQTVPCSGRALFVIESFGNPAPRLSRNFSRNRSRSVLRLPLGGCQGILTSPHELALSIGVDGDGRIRSWAECGSGG